MAFMSNFGENTPTIVISSLFSKYDTDESGHLGHSELIRLFVDDFGLDQAKAENYVLLLDKDGSGKLSKQEFIQWIREGDRFQNVNDSSRYYILSKATEQFRVYDKDQSNQIDKEEFREMMLGMGCAEDQIGSALVQLDTNNDGKISFPEFLKWLNWMPIN